MLEMLEDYTSRHSEYQITNFIIKLNGKTDYGQYRQCLRELVNRFKTLQNAEGFNRKELIREFKIFYSVAKQLKEKIGVLTPHKKKVLESDFWVETFKYRIALELVCYGRPQMASIESVLAMPEKEIMLDFLDEITAPGAAKNYLKHTDFTEYKPIELISDADVEKIIGKGDFFGRLLESNAGEESCAKVERHIDFKTDS